MSHWYQLKKWLPRYELYRIRCESREDAGEERAAVERDEFERVQQFSERYVMTQLIQYKREDLLAVTEVAKQCRPAALAKLDEFEQSLTLAGAMRRLDELITPEMMKDVLLLMNSPIGFMTDRVPPKDQPYDGAIVKQCFIEATLRGARTVGNEWNIISAKAYLTRSYYERALKELPDLKKLKIVPGIPVMRDGGAIVKMKATWVYQGQLGDLERDIAVRVNAGMGTDAILGKADRKFRAAIYRQLTGTSWAEDEEDLPAENAPVTVIETTAVQTEPTVKAMTYDAIEKAIRAATTTKELDDLIPEIGISLQHEQITNDGANKLGAMIESVRTALKRRK